MPLPLPEFFEKFKKFHGIYVMKKTYEGTCAFITGYEAGSDSFYMKDFHEWVLRRGRGHPELYWPLLVLCELYDEGGLPDVRYFTTEQDERAVDVILRPA